MMGQIKTTFIKRMKLILCQMEKSPRKSCKQAVKATPKEVILSPTPAIEPVEIDQAGLCTCYDQGIEALHVAFWGTPSFDSLETKESGLEYIRRALGPLELMSSCKQCAEEEHVRVFLHLLCRTILDRCRAFYALLAQTYEVEDGQPLLLDESRYATVDDRAAVLSILTHLEMMRFHYCVGRIMEALRAHPVLDEDAWILIQGQAYRLAMDSMELSFQSIDD